MKKDYSHITPEEYDRYLKGKLSPEEAYRLERIMQAHSLYDEAGDGMESIDPELFREDMESLKSRFKTEKNSDKAVIAWWKYAATISLLLISIPLIWYLLQSGPLDAPLSMEKSATESPEAQPEKATGTQEDPAISPTESSNEPEIIWEEEKPDQTANREVMRPVPQRSTKSSAVDKSSGLGSAPPEVAELADKVEVLEETVVEEIYFEENLTEAGSEKEEDSQERARQMAYAKEENKRKKMAASKSVSPAPATYNSLRADSITADQVATITENERRADNLGFFPLLYPRPDSRQVDFEKYLRNREVFLKERRRTEKLSIAFTVNADSTLTDYILIEGERESFNMVVKILSAGPVWIPSQDSLRNQVKRSFWIRKKKR